MTSQTYALVHDLLQAKIAAAQASDLRCGQCGWQRKLICCNPKSPRADSPVNKGTPACDQHQKSTKKKA